MSKYILLIMMPHHVYVNVLGLKDKQKYGLEKCDHVRSFSTIKFFLRHRRTCKPTCGNTRQRHARLSRLWAHRGRSSLCQLWLITPRPAHSSASEQYSLSLSDMAQHWYVHFLSFVKVIVLSRQHMMILLYWLCRAVFGRGPTMRGQSNLPLTFCAWLGLVLVPFPALLISSPLFVILSPIPRACTSASPPGLCTASTNEASRLERACREKTVEAASGNLWDLVNRRGVCLWSLCMKGLAFRVVPLSWSGASHAHSCISAQSTRLLGVGGNPMAGSAPWSV